MLSVERVYIMFYCAFNYLGITLSAEIGSLLVTLSHIKLVKHIGEHFDWKVKEWQKVAED